MLKKSGNWEIWLRICTGRRRKQRKGGFSTVDNHGSFVDNLWALPVKTAINLLVFQYYA